MATAQQKRAVLATVVHIEGSAYRAPGARMLITEDGMLTGAVSGGCLEGDVLRKALLVMTGEQPLLVTYDTSDEEDHVIGVSLGCNGIIRILLEPLPDADDNAIVLLKEAVAERSPAVVVTFFAEKDKLHRLQGTRLCWTQRGLHAITPPVSAVAADIQLAVTRGSSTFVQYAEGFTAFIEYLAPAPALVIAGAGNDVMPLAGMAEILGWSVTLIDGRPAYAKQQRFPGCQVLIAQPEQALSNLAIDEDTAIVLMSHNYHYDKAVLEAAVKTDARYIGILGPHKKRARLLEELPPLSAAQLGKIYGPTGLDIGAETAEEIALSIIAEIKSVFAGRQGQALRDKQGHIHMRHTQFTPSLQEYAVLVLAAGASRRLGQAKQQLAFEGETLLQRATRTALSIGAATTAVITSEAATLPATVIVNHQHAEGMASAIRLGVEHLDKYQFILVMLCDQPYVNTAHLLQLIAAQQVSGAPVAASLYAGRKGVPALFHRSQFAALQSLQGDTGAKHLIEQLGDMVTSVPFPEGAFDIDTREAYQQLIKTEHD